MTVRKEIDMERVGGYKYKGIVFDLDNTLLRSSIDFAKMKQSVFDLLVGQGIFPGDFPLRDHTTATLIESARATGRFSPELERKAWDIVVRLEREGMRGADLEPNVREVLAKLHSRLTLVVLTNNARSAALDALERTGVARCFDLVVGREQMGALKPSPCGFRYVLSQYAGTAPKQWLAVGDSWIDGKAAQDAGVPFLAYRSDEKQLERHGVKPIGRIESMSDLLAFCKMTEPDVP